MIVALISSSLIFLTQVDTKDEYRLIKIVLLLTYSEMVSSL